MGDQLCEFGRGDARKPPLQAATGAGLNGEGPAPGVPTHDRGAVRVLGEEQVQPRNQGLPVGGDQQVAKSPPQRPDAFQIPYPGCSADLVLGEEAFQGTRIREPLGIVQVGVPRVDDV